MRDRGVLKTGTYADVSAIAGSTQDTALSFAAAESAVDISASLQTPASPGLAPCSPPGGDEARTSSGQVPATSGSVQGGIYHSGESPVGESLAGETAYLDGRMFCNACLLAMVARPLPRRSLGAKAPKRPLIAPSLGGEANLASP